MGDGDDHVLALDQVFLLHLPFLVYDLGAPRRGKFAPHGSQLVLDDGLDTRPRAQDIEVIGNLGSELVELRLDLVAAERGQALQPQVEDGFGLLGRELVRALRGHPVARIVDERDHRLDVPRRPVACH